MLTATRTGVGVFPLARPRERFGVTSGVAVAVAASIVGLTAAFRIEVPALGGATLDRLGRGISELETSGAMASEGAEFPFIPISEIPIRMGIVMAIANKS